MAQNSKHCSSDASRFHNMLPGHIDQASYLAVKESIETSVVSENYSSSGPLSVLSSLQSVKSYSKASASNVISPEINSTIKVCDGSTDIKVASTSPHSQVMFDLDIVTPSPDTSDAFSSRHFILNKCNSNPHTQTDEVLGFSSSFKTSHSPHLVSTSRYSPDMLLSTNMAPVSFKNCLHYPQMSYFDAPSKYLRVPTELEKKSRCEICQTSVENKVCMEQDRNLCEQFLGSLSRFEDWLQITQMATSIPNPSQTLPRKAKLVLKRYEVLIKEMREKLLDLESLNRQYWKISQRPHQILLPSALRCRMQEVNQSWDRLQREAEIIHRTLKSKVQQREEFDTDQDAIKLCLTEMDLELSSVEFIYSGNSTDKIQQLKAFQENVWNNMKRVEGLLERGDELMYDSDLQDAETLEKEMTELGSYCQEIFIRLSRLHKRLVSTKLVFEDDFLDSGFEHVSSGSSDVFLDLDLEDKDVPKPPTLAPTKAALPVDLEWDPTGDVGSSGSRDGHDSFYTTASTPWKIQRNRKASESSLSSDSGVTNSKHRSQEDLFTVEEELPDRSVSTHALMLEKSRRPKKDIHTQSVDTLALYKTLPTTEAGMLEVVTSYESLRVDAPDSGQKIDNSYVSGYVSALPGQEPPVNFNSQETNGFIYHGIAGQRRRQGKKQQVVQIEDTKSKLQHPKQDVSILMDNGDDMNHLVPCKSSSGCQGSLWHCFRRLAPLYILFLLLCGSLLVIPLSHPRCSLQRFSWTLMLTYVNGPPPT